MAALTISSITVKDGGGSNVTAGTATDGTRQLPATGLLGADGATFQPSGATKSTEINTAARTNATRNAGVAHRASVTARDKMADPAQLASAVGVTVTSATLVSATGYYYTVVGRNAQGTTLAATIQGATTPGGSFNALEVTIPQITGATFYDLFLSTSSTGPLWVCSVSETTRAAGGGQCITVGTVATGGGAAAGKFRIGVVGTGQASNSSQFATNTGYIVPGSISPINCTGYSRAHVIVKLAVDDMRSAPALTLVPFFGNQNDSGVYYAGAPMPLNLAGAAGASLLQDFVLDVDGCPNFLLAIDTISGQNAAASVWVELS